MRAHIERRHRTATGPGPGPERLDFDQRQPMKSLAPIVMALFLAASSLTAAAQESNGAEKLDLDSFKIISQRNIFDPTRTGRRARSRPAARLVERVSLVGTSVDPGEEAAFVTGDGVPDRPLKLGDAVKE